MEDDIDYKKLIMNGPLALGCGPITEPPDDELNALAQQVVDRFRLHKQKPWDQMTPEEKQEFLDAGVAFIMNTDFGGT